MKIHILPLAILSTLLSSCMNQPSAPIDYASTTLSSSRGSAPSSSEEIIEKPIIHEKTKWGDSQIHEETQNVTPNETSIIHETPQIHNPPLRTETISHEVIEGETVNSIAKQYGIERDSLIRANKLKAPYKLEELQIIKIPPQVSLNEDVSDIAATNTVEQNAQTVSPPSESAGILLALPVEGSIISKFGEINDGVKNNGMNIEAPLGSDVHSLSSGSVVFSGNDPKFGNLIIVKSEDTDIFMAYSHMNDLILKKGDLVSNGQIVGHVGQTGNVTSPQLHFAVRQGKTPIDPAKYLNDKINYN